MGPLKAQEPAPMRSGFLFLIEQQSLLELLIVKKKPTLRKAEAGFASFSGVVLPGRFAEQINPGHLSDSSKACLSFSRQKTTNKFWITSNYLVEDAFYLLIPETINSLFLAKPHKDLFKTRSL